MSKFRLSSICAICGKPIDQSQPSIRFPPFTGNPSDPLHKFSDAVVHANEIDAHPLAAKLKKRLSDFETHKSAAMKVCRICGKQIVEYRDYVGLGHLVDDVTSELNDWNYAHFHRSCFSRWDGADALVSKLQELQRLAYWDKAAFDRLMNCLKRET